MAALIHINQEKSSREHIHMLLFFRVGNYINVRPYEEKKKYSFLLKLTILAFGKLTLKPLYSFCDCYYNS